MRGRMLKLGLLLCFLVLLLYYPTEAASAAREGVQLCLDLIVPSLFPFFVFSALFVSLGLAEFSGRLLKPLMARLFRLGGAAATPVLLGLLGGYPVGIRTAADLYESGQCSREEFVRLSFFCNNCGPAFLLSVAGIGIFCAKEAGYLLLFTHWGAALVLALLSRFLFQATASAQRNPLPAAKHLPFSAAFPNSVRDAFASTLNVCAFVILFCVLIALATTSGLLPFFAGALSALLPEAFPPALCKSFLIGIFELSTGAYSLAEAYASPLALPLCAFILAWGGLSVHCQSLPYLNRCPDSIKPYFFGKLLHGLLAGVLVAMLAPLLPVQTAAAVPVGVWSAPAAALLRQELLALFLLSGAFFFLTGKKAGKTAKAAV